MGQINPKVDHIVDAANELAASYKEALPLMSQFVAQEREIKELYGVGRDGSRSPLLSLGISLFLIPDPFTTPVGAALLAVGLAQQKISGPPLFIEGLYSSLHDSANSLLRNSYEIACLSALSDQFGLDLSPMEDICGKDACDVKNSSRP